MSNANNPAALGPIHSVDRDGSQVFVRHGNGLTKREHFAAMAMQGVATQMESMCHACPAGKTPAEYMAEQAVGLADALLSELEKSQ